MSYVQILGIKSNEVLVKRDKYGFPQAFLVFDQTENRWAIRREENVFKFSNKNIGTCLGYIHND